MSEIKLHGLGPIARSADDAQERPRKLRDEGDSSGSTEAVRFLREETSSYAIYRAAAEGVESAQPSRVAEYRAQIANGTYHPDMKLVAERIVAEISRG